MGLFGILAIETIAAMVYSSNVEKEANLINYKAGGKIASAKNSVEKQQQELVNNMMINAKRKNALINYHLKLFQEQYQIIRKIEFKKGEGLKELEKIDAIKDALVTYRELPTIANEKAMTDGQYLASWVLLGIPGLAIKEAKAELNVAQRNMSKANAYASNVKTYAIMFEGLNQHISIITSLLERLGILYLKSINHITEILKCNGLNGDAYSQQDIDDLNISLMMTKLVYRIINTKLIDENGKITSESLKVISESNQMLNEIALIE